MFGYNGKILVVDLSTSSSRWEPLDSQVLRDFIGGAGLAAYLLYEFCPRGADPLGPENPLIFATSPLVGSRLTTSSKFAVAAKSPMTGFIGDSLSSSFLAPELKKTGCDAIVILGRAASPTLLAIDENGVRFEDASGLAGLGASDTEAAVKDMLDKPFRVACIGPAGENLVRFASISNDGGRQAGRTGTGAVMGSKNLKAIAVRGRDTVPVRAPDALRRIGADLSRRSLGDATEKYRNMGTVANMLVFNRLGSLPTRNFSAATFDGAEGVSGEELRTTHHVRNAHCANCTIGCEQIVVTTDGGKQSKGRMEYESSFALGPLVGVSDANAVIRASHFCDDAGIDTISAGVTIAWAMECYERGILASEDTDGLDLSFGNADALAAVLRLIAERRGIGELLAGGVRSASRAIGRGSEDWAMHVKGLEMPGYEPRSLKTMALGLAVSTRGACHNRSSAYEADFSSRVDRLAIDEHRGQITADGEDFSAVLDSLIWCKFLRKAFDDLYEESAEIYGHVTGWQTSAQDLRKAGERINNLRKLFNIREGWTRSDDGLPPRALSEPLTDAPVDGVRLTGNELNNMIEGYYRARGWTPDGLIPEAKLTELGLTGMLAGRASLAG